jgi:hypothetical protein
LRIAYTKKDEALQKKLCDKLIEQKKDFEDAMSNVRNIETKNTPLDHVKSAIRIVRKGNDKSLRFTSMFRDRVYQINHSIRTKYYCTVFLIF